MYRIFILFICLFMSQETYVLIDFTNTSKENWQIVDDVVMGGVSRGNFQINQKGHGFFSGDVSLANNGGFSSVRFDLPTTEVTEYDGVRLFLKGDGKPYQFRIRNSYLHQYTYSTKFSTNGDWQVVEIPFSSMVATFRGYRLDLPKYEGDKIEEIAFLIGNKREESFELLVDRVELY